MTLLVVLITSIIAIVSLCVLVQHSWVVANTKNHPGLSPWHIVCLAMSLNMFCLYGAIYTVGREPPVVIFIMAGCLALIAFLIVISHLWKRSKNET